MSNFAQKFYEMYRTHTCGELSLAEINQKVTLAGWIQRSRQLSGMTFIDLRDRYGITQLVFTKDKPELYAAANDLNREFVIQIEGIVTERQSKNPKLSTGDIEIIVENLKVLNPSKLPPFTIEDDTDGGDELRMKYRYLDLRRPALRNNLILRHKLAQEVRRYLDSKGFIEVETPVLIKSTPEGARDFVVPSRMNPNQFYALPQSPQQQKQLLMVAGFDKYFQIVKCFRDEDLRADRQPEFTQIDCEMSFVHQEDVLQNFEGMIKHLFKTVLNYDFSKPFRRMPYEEAMSKYGSDKPDLRFGMEIHRITDLAKGFGFAPFENAQEILAIKAENCAAYTRKQLDALTNFVKRPQIGATGLIYVKYSADGAISSSVDKYFAAEQVQKWAETLGAKPGDLILIMAGKSPKIYGQIGELRLEMGNILGLRPKDKFVPLWVVDFPLFEWDEETERFYAMHHPFTSPKLEDIPFFKTDPGKVHANAYDCVINGVELGGGSIRIHDQGLQEDMFEVLGFTKEQAEYQFGFLMNAFRYGAPPHGGIAFGFDRMVSMFAGLDSIRDVIAFPKNNTGRDVMIDAPSLIDDAQLKELNLSLITPSEN